MIPKIIHQIWVGDFKIPNREKGLVEKIKNLHPDYEYRFWNIPDNDLPENIKYCYDKFYKIKNYAFCADLLRIWVVYKYGGFYLDIDFDIKNKLDYFFDFDGVFFYHNDLDFTIPNNIFASKSNAPILEYCLNMIQPNCNWYGPSWFGKVIKEYLQLEYEVKQDLVKNSLQKLNIEYYQYWPFELKYGKHLSLYSWSPEVWNRLNNYEQL